VSDDRGERLWAVRGAAQAERNDPGDAEADARRRAGSAERDQSAHERQAQAAVVDRCRAAGERGVEELAAPDLRSQARSSRARGLMRCV